MKSKTFTRSSSFSITLHTQRRALILVQVFGALVLGWGLPQPARGVETNSMTLIQAVRSGDLDQVNACLINKPDVNEKSANGRTPLMIAAMNGHLELVKILLNRGADTRIQDNDGKTAKQLAVQLNQPEVVKALDQAETSNDPQLALFVAVKAGDAGAVRRALEKGADVNVPAAMGVTALMATSAQGNHELLKFLLEKGASINAVDNDGRTAFDFADLPGRPTDEESQRLLTEKGAITEKFIALRLNDMLRDAVRNGDIDKVSAALAKKADPNYVGKDGNQTVLMYAAEAGHLEIVNQLLKAGANPNRAITTGNDYWKGKTALLFAVAEGRLEVVKALLAKGANVNVQQRTTGVTPLIVASASGWVDIVKLLIEQGANLDMKEEKGRTALMLAGGEKRSEIQALLMKAGAAGKPVQAPNKQVVGPANIKPAPPVDSKSLTKADWKKAYYSRFPAGSIATVARFKNVFGQPIRTQTVEQDAYWYFQCSDGVIQVVLNDPNVFGSGACIQSINDY